MSFDKFTFKPAHQPNEASPVEFELKPLDMQTFFRLQASINRTGDATWEDCVAILHGNVLGWRGLPVEFSQGEKNRMLAGEADSSLYVWLGQIAGELYQKALLRGAERKNS